MAAVIGRPGRNLRPDQAGAYIAGYTIFNDWSARDLQMAEMALGLGTCKGKDFANTLGPWIVTADELEPYRTSGDRLDLDLRATVNGHELGSGDTLANMAWSFEELVSYASRGTWVRAGDVLGSGTCGNGCLFELWGRQGPDVHPPLGPGDTVALTVEGIGTLTNTVVAGDDPVALPTARPGRLRERACGMTRIDAHAHVLPDAYVELLGGVPALPAPLDGLQATMERHDIDAAVISTGPPGAFVGDVGQARELARAANEGIAQIVRDAPHRFAGLATLPLPDVGAAVAEVAQAFDQLELDGVMLLSHTAGTYLGDPILDPVLAELDRRGAYVFVHPTLPPYAPPIAHHPVWLYEFPFETVRAITSLIYGGALERYPNIRWQFSHLGGAAPFLAHRIASLADREPGAALAAPAGALEYLRRLYYDTGLSNHAPGLAATCEITDLDHVVFGTDWPYAALPAGGGDPAPGLDVLGERGRAAVDAGNVGALVPRLVGAPA